MTRPTTHRIGDARITRITEFVTEAFTLGRLVPEAATAEAVAGAWSRAEDPVRLSIHSWLVEIDGLRLLVDTGVGSHKQREGRPLFHDRDDPFLERLAEAGVRPTDVDVVLSTHLHTDHIGWNTRLVDGAWRPTFPNARHVVSAAELDWLATSTDPYRVQLHRDSLLPLVEAGLVETIGTGGGSPLPRVTFVPSPGHSFDHMCIALDTGAERALFSGDLMHHPIQTARPQWNSGFCEVPDAARASRVRLLDAHAGDDTIFFTAHFAESSAGRVGRVAGGYDWRFL